MSWGLEWGEKLEYLEDLRDSGMDPLALKNRPPCYRWMSEYLQAFNILSSTRQYGMGPNPIQLTEILAYIQLYGSSDNDVLVRYVLKMDEAYLTTKAKKQQQNSQVDKEKR